MSSIKKPYDLIFKHTLTNDVAIKDFLSVHLPKNLRKRIDLDSVKPTKASYVPAELRELHSDLVCTCKIDGKQGILYLIVEHQSKEVWIMPLRFIKYKTDLIEDYLRGKPKGTPWPIVVCCCLYHGEKSPYPYPTEVHRYFSDPKLAKELGIFENFHLIDLAIQDDAELQQHNSPALMERTLKYSRDRDFPYPTEVYSYFSDPKLAKELGIFEKFHLIDLTIQDDEELQQHHSLSLMERILKYSQDRDFFNSLSSFLEEYKESLLSLESPLGEDYWYSVYLVLVSLSSQHGYQEGEIASLFAEHLDLLQTKEEIMNIRDVLRQEALQEGMQRGIQRGIQKGRQEGMQQGIQKGMEQGMHQEKLGIAKNMLVNLHLGIDVVQKATGLSREALRKLQTEE